MMKTAGNVKIIQTNLIMNDFTLHGLHLNISGKENMAELIGEKIKKKTIGKNRRNPHQSEVGRNQKDPTQKEAKETLINDYIKEPNLKEIRSSETQKRNPVTRIEDFFYG